MGISAPWITKSYLEMILESKGWNLDINFFLLVFIHVFLALLSKVPSSFLKLWSQLEFSSFEFL